MKRSTASTMVLRISLILAIIAALAGGGLGVRVRQKVLDLQSRLAAETSARHQTETEMAGTRRDLAATTTNLKETRTALETAGAEKRQALVSVAAQSQRAEKLAQDLAASREKCEGAQAEVARYKAAGMEPEQILIVGRQFRDLQKNLASVQGERDALQVKLRLARGNADPNPLLPADLRAKVIVSDPKWHFVVLDAGEKQGVVERGELLVRREGKLIARAKVSRVQNESCVANLLPGWEFAQVIEGDVVLPAPPHS